MELTLRRQHGAEVAGRDDAKRRTGPEGGKADGGGEETGRGTSRAAGVGVQARREGCAEITSGRSAGPAGGGPSCQDSLREPQAQRGRGPRSGTSGHSSRRAKGLWTRRATGTVSRGRVTPGIKPAAQGGSYPRRQTVASGGYADHGLST